MTADMTARITELLTALGKTAGEVADSLAERGIRGLPAAPKSCPIARYLQSNGIGATFVSALRVEVGLEFEHPLPGPVADFVVAFDDDPDDFPALVEAMS